LFEATFVGDTVVDPFAGTGTTALAAMESGRNSISVEVEPSYIAIMRRRLVQPALNASITFFDAKARGAVALARRA